MLGPEGAAELAAAWLTSRLPDRLERIAAERNLDDPLPTPAVVLPFDKLSLGVEEWPAVLVVGQALRNLGPAEASDGVERYRARYNLRVFAWVRDEDELATDALRKRYVLAIREALLERRSLTAGTYGIPGTSPIAVDPLSIAESYSDLVVDEAGRTIAGAWLDVDVLVDELLTLPTLGTVATPVTLDPTVDGDTATIPPHPGLT